MRRFKIIYLFPKREIKTAINVSCGGSHTVVLISDKVMYVFGKNDDRLGAANLGLDGGKKPFCIMELQDVSTMCAAEEHNIAILKNGEVRSWGLQGLYRKLGNYVPTNGISTRKDGEDAKNDNDGRRQNKFNNGERKFKKQQETAKKQREGAYVENNDDDDDLDEDDSAGRFIQPLNFSAIQRALVYEFRSRDGILHVTAVYNKSFIIDKFKFTVSQLFQQKRLRNVQFAVPGSVTVFNLSAFCILVEDIVMQSMLL